MAVLPEDLARAGERNATDGADFTINALPVRSPTVEQGTIGADTGMPPPWLAKTPESRGGSSRMNAKKAKTPVEPKPPKRPGRYAQIIDKIFFERYKEGALRLEFSRNDIKATAAAYRSTSWRCCKGSPSAISHPI